MNCAGVTNVDSVTCSISGRTITVELTRVAATTGAYSWTISNIGNPPSTITSSSFTNVTVSDRNDFLALVLRPTVITVTNQQPAMITTYGIEQDSLVTGALTNYTLHFTPVNPLPSKGSI